MPSETAKVERYLEDTLGLAVRFHPWVPEERLPIFLRDNYHFYAGELLHSHCLLMIDQSSQEVSPSTIRKHLNWVIDKWPLPVVYVRDRLPSYQRRRLIEQRVPFLIPGNQMYLPMLGIDLREHFRSERPTQTNVMPATQAVILHLLNNRDRHPQNPAELAERLGYTRMTMSRVLDELEAEQLCEVTKEGRERWLRLKESPRELWSTALPMMRSPVQHRYYMHWWGSEPPGPKAGLSALANLSMLAPPNRPVFAVATDGWRQLRTSKRLPNEVDAEDVIEAEVWRYNPKLFSNGVVDRFSLFLSLRDNEDERIQLALEEMMEGIQW